MNVDWIYHLPAPFRRALYFALQRAIGSRIASAYSDFLAWTRSSPDQVQEYTEKRLGSLLNHAVNNSPHYRGNVVSAGKPSQALKKFPILTRSAVRSDFQQIVTRHLQSEIRGPDSKSRKRYDWLVVKTGGTTGVPTSVVHDANGRDSGRATRLFAQKLCGFPLGTRYFRLWGSESDLLQQQDNVERRVLRNLLGEVSMNSFKASREALANHLQTLRANPDIRHMMAYIDSAAALAQFAKSQEPKPPALRTVMGCAGNVTPEYRQVLEQVFQCKVFDKYGSRECSDIACECAAHRGLHILSPAVYVEVVDENGRSVPSGVQGRILVTMLNNYAFPMIRYDIGDLGVLAENSPCPCGLNFPKLASLQGRMDDVLLTNDGNPLTSVFVRHFVGVSLNQELISEWQLEQTSHTKLIFRYIPLQERGLAENLKALEGAFKKAFGTSTSTEFQKVSSIPPSATGKWRWIINNCKPNNAEMATVQ